MVFLGSKTVSLRMTMDMEIYSGLNKTLRNASLGRFGLRQVVLSGLRGGRARSSVERETLVHVRGTPFRIFKPT